MEVYPAIDVKAKREGVAIFFHDESGMRSDAHAGTTWGLKGTTPVVKATDASFGFNILSTVNAKGQCCCMIVKRRMIAVVFCEFLRRLLQGMNLKIVLKCGWPSHAYGQTGVAVYRRAGRPAGVVRFAALFARPEPR